MRKRRIALQEAPRLPWALVAAVAGAKEPPWSSGPGLLYVARAASGQIKIGCANYPAWRVHVQTIPSQRIYCAHAGIDTSTLKLLFIVDPGGWGRESALHRAFADEKATIIGPREWFTGPRIEACVATLLAQTGRAAA